MSNCTLCNIALGEQPVEVSEISGSFCCQGCLEVYRTLGSVEPSKLESDQPTQPAIPEDASTVYLNVAGMHCSTCELYLESLAAGCDGIYRITASYASEALKVSYDPDRIEIEEIIERLSVTGYTASRRDEESAEKTDMASRLLVGGLFGMMAMTWYVLFLYPTYFGFDPIVELGTFDGAYLYGQLAVVTAIILLYTGRPILRGAYISLRTRQPNVDLLVMIAALAAYFHSTGRLLIGGTDLYYDVTIVVVLAVTVGTYYEGRIKQQVTGLLSELTKLQVTEATRPDGRQIPVSDLTSGEILQVKPGERIPVDGTITEGSTAVDESLVTGESLPVLKTPGDTVRGGTIVTDAPIFMQVGESADSTIDRILEQLWEIQATKPGAQRIADRLSIVFVPIVLLLAALISGFLLLSGQSLQVAVLTGLTVLIVSCPCALGLATPLAIASGLQSAASRGIVLTSPRPFDVGTSVETVVFDKTGTLTTGEMAVTGIYATECAKAELLYRATAVEQYSEHPIARAITKAYTESGDHTNFENKRDCDDLARRNPSEIQSGTGGIGGVTVDSVTQHTRGLAASVDGEKVVVGHPGFLREQGIPLGNCEKAVAAIEQRGDRPIVVGWDERAQGVLSVGDSPRKNWESVVETLGEHHDIVVLTGDDSRAVNQFSSHPAIDHVFTGVPPEGKAETIRTFSASGTVAMVGDGSNDATALAAADLGIAMATGTKLATDAADAILVDDELEHVPAVFEIAGRTRRRIRENLAWAFVYNGIAIPLALLGLLNPLFAALAMASSSLLVVANSARNQAPNSGVNTEIAPPSEGTTTENTEPNSSPTPTNL